MSVSIKRLSQFMSAYADAYERQLGGLSQRLQEMVRALPPCLLSGQVVTYMLSDSVIICDEATTPLRASLPFCTFDKVSTKVNGRNLEVRKIDTSLVEFTDFLTLGHFRFIPEPKPQEFGHTSSVSFLTFKTRNQQRYVGETEIFYYLDESGWDRRWAWLVAKEHLQRSVFTAIFRLMVNAGLASEKEKEELGYEKTALLGLERFRRSVSQFENLLRTHLNDEQKFQELFEKYPYLLSMRGRVIPKPFLRCQIPLTTIRTGRIPDFMVKELDGSCTLVEIERPGKNIFTKSKNPQPTRYVTQAENQVRQWDQIIRNNPSITTIYPGIEYYTARVIIGRSYHPAFPSFASFQSELASLNKQRVNARFETYDVILEGARKAIDFLELVFSGF